MGTTVNDAKVYSYGICHRKYSIVDFNARGVKSSIVPVIARINLFQRLGHGAFVRFVNRAVFD